MSTLSSSSGDSAALRRIAIVGGGISGCAAARQLVAESDKVHVTIFDWGRTVGGRASHRCRPEPTSSANPDDILTLPFDHGAQFFHSQNKYFLDLVRPVIQRWPKDLSRLGWLERDSGIFASSKDAAASTKNNPTSKGFFGVCNTALDDQRYVGIGGMNAMCQEMIRSAEKLAPDRMQIKEGTRVARCEQLNTTTTSTTKDDDTSKKRWKLFGDGLGHEQANTNALEESSTNCLGEFDELIISDHMAAAMPSWHPCHIVGLEDAVPALVSALRKALGWDESARRFTAVQPLFSCMVAFERDTESLPLNMDFDAAAVQGSDVLQWICSQDSRPHNDNDQQQLLDRWILMSTMDFATKCLGSEGMSKTSPSESTKVEYIPQTDDYLRSDPAKLMCDEFLTIMEKARSSIDNRRMPCVVYSKCQRWGAAFTTRPKSEMCPNLAAILTSHEQEQLVTLCGDFVDALLKTTSTTSQSGDSDTDWFAIERAALSGIHAAKRVASRIL